MGKASKYRRSEFELMIHWSYPQIWSIVLKSDISRQGSTSWWLSPNIVKVYHFYMRLLISSWSFPPFSIIFVSCALAGLLLGKARMTQSEQSKQLWRGDVWRGRRNIFQNRFVCGMRLKSASKRTHPASLSYWKLISWPLSKASRSPGEQR